MTTLHVLAGFLPVFSFFFFLSDYPTLYWFLLPCDSFPQTQGPRTTPVYYLTVSLVLKSRWAQLASLCRLSGPSQGVSQSLVWRLGRLSFQIHPGDMADHGVSQDQGPCFPLAVTRGLSQNVEASLQVLPKVVSIFKCKGVSNSSHASSL